MGTHERTIELAKLREDMRIVREQILELKARRKQSTFKDGVHMWTWKEAADFGRLKVEATILYAIRAGHRGRKHLTRFPYAGFADEAAFEKHLGDVRGARYGLQLAA